MQTRSQTYNKKVEFTVYIDFDESSRAWRANKRHVGDGHFEYTDVPRNNLKHSVWCPIQEDPIESLPPRRRRSPNRYSS